MDKVGINSKRAGWFFVSVVALVVPVSIYLLLDFFYGGDESEVQTYGVWLTILAAVNSVALLVSAIAAYKLKGRKRLVPLGGIFVLIVILCISILGAALGGFAESH